MAKSVSVFAKQYKYLEREGSHNHTWTTNYDHQLIREVLRKNSLFVATETSPSMGDFQSESYLWFDGKSLSRATVSLRNPLGIEPKKECYFVRVEVETMPPSNTPEGLVKLLHENGFEEFNQASR